MTDRDDIERLVRSAYEARIRGDLEALMRNFTDGAQFTLAGSTAASPVPLSATGSGAVREVLRRLLEGFSFLDARLISLLVDGERAAVHWTVTVRANATGREARTDLLDLFRFDNGRIASLHQFADTALAAQLLAP